jgi:hypothetical protein
MYLNDDGAPAFAANPLGTAIGVACAAVLVAMFLGFNPLTRLTTAYSELQPVVEGRAVRPAGTVVIGDQPADAVPAGEMVAR